MYEFYLKNAKIFYNIATYLIILVIFYLAYVQTQHLNNW